VRKSKVSIIIPAYNEEAYICKTLKSIACLHPAPFEVILVDGQSEDRTCEKATSFNLKVISSEKGRARQMNRGAEVARGQYLCFIHADTWVPEDLLDWVEEALANPRTSAGAFLSRMRGRKHRRFTTLHNRIKTYYAPMLYRPYHTLFKGLRLLFGDQVIFCRREDFLRVGGFNPDDLILEEANLCLRMNKIGRLRQLPHWVESSDRRVEDWGGEVKANAIYFLLTLGWAFRIPQKKLAQYYRDVR
ncbi:MAG: TIGR04283 family arsenosugar biosynthesis glycosyltransferase, partial [Bacteroidota bacterium]